MQRRDWLQRSALTVFGAGFPLHAVRAQTQDRYARFRGTTLNISIPAHPHYDAMRALLPKFTQQTGIKVEVDQQAFPKMKERQLQDQKKPQHSFDLISYVVMWKSEYVTKGLLRELKPLMDNPALMDPNYDFNDLAPNYVENIGLVGGWRGYLAGPTAKLYGLPYGAETSILAYRKDIFDQLGLQPPSTYFEMERLLPTLKARSGMGALATRSQRGHQCVHAWLLHLNPMGGNVFDLQWRPNFNDPRGVRALELLKQIVDTGPAGGSQFDQNQMMASFLGGESAMYLDSTIIMGGVRDPKRSKVSGKVAYSRHPKAAAYASQSGGLGLGIPTNARNPEAAFMLLQWLTNKENDKAVTLLGGAPARHSTLAAPDVLQQYPEYQVLASQIRDAAPDWRPIIPEWDDINNNYLGAAIHDALSGKSTPKAALDAMAPKVQALMQKAGYLKG